MYPKILLTSEESILKNHKKNKRNWESHHKKCSTRIDGSTSPHPRSQSKCDLLSTVIGTEEKRKDYTTNQEQ